MGLSDKFYEVFESEESKKLAIEKMKSAFAQQMTPDQYLKTCEWIENASPEALDSMLIWAMGGSVKAEENGIITIKDRLEYDRKFMKEFGIKSKDTASANFRPNFLSEQNNKYCIEEILKSHPSDYLYLSRKEDLFLCDLWEPEDKSELFIPSDLFFANTVPLKDCVITVDERNSDVDGGSSVQYRVVVFDDYEKHIKWAVDEKDGNGIIVVGAAIPMNLARNDFFMPLLIVPGYDSLVMGGTFGWFSVAAKNDLNNQGITRQMAVQWFTSLIETWYGIQIALLHPAVKEVFARPQRCKEESQIKNDSTTRKRKAKYIRKHVLTLDNLEAVSHSKEARKINRKCLAWYVIGHWRTYKNGKKVFIMPYWKGALRNLRQNMPGDDRDREINMEWDTNPILNNIGKGFS